MYIEVVHLVVWTSVSTVGLSERGLNLSYITCGLKAICYVLCIELVLGFWGLEPETNLKRMNMYWSAASSIFECLALTVGLSERGLNLGNFTCSLIALCYVLCRELVIGFWGLEPETNLKWMNILKLCTSYFERPSRLSVYLRGVWTCMFYM